MYCIEIQVTCEFITRNEAYRLKRDVGISVV